MINFVICLIFFVVLEELFGEAVVDLRFFLLQAFDAVGVVFEGFE